MHHSWSSWHFICSCLLMTRTSSWRRTRSLVSQRVWRASARAASEVRTEVRSLRVLFPRAEECQDPWGRAPPSTTDPPWSSRWRERIKASSVLRKEYKCWLIKTVDCPIPAIPDLEEEYSDSSSSHLEIMMSIYFNSQNFHKIILNSFKRNLESYNNQRNIAFSTF